jgi:hypothetical protein
MRGFSYARWRQIIIELTYSEYASELDSREQLSGLQIHHSNRDKSPADGCFKPKIADTRARHSQIPRRSVRAQFLRCCHSGGSNDGSQSVKYEFYEGSSRSVVQLPENASELSRICHISCLHRGFAEMLVRLENHLPVCVVKNDCESPQHLGADDPCQVRGG